MRMRAHLRNSHMCHASKICGENFRGTAQIREIRESFLPQKFPAIRYSIFFINVSPTLTIQTDNVGQIHQTAHHRIGWPFEWEWVSGGGGGGGEWWPGGAGSGGGGDRYSSEETKIKVSQVRERRVVMCPVVVMRERGRMWGRRYTVPIFRVDHIIPYYVTISLTKCIHSPIKLDPLRLKANYHHCGLSQLPQICLILIVRSAASRRSRWVNSWRTVLIALVVFSVAVIISLMVAMLATEPRPEPSDKQSKQGTNYNWINGSLSSITYDDVIDPFPVLQIMM